MEVKVGKVYRKFGVDGEYVVILAVGNHTERYAKQDHKDEKKIVIFKNLKDGKIYSMDYEEFVKPICDSDSKVIDCTAQLIEDYSAIAKKIITKKELKLLKKIAGMLEVEEYTNEVEL